MSFRKWYAILSSTPIIIRAMPQPVAAPEKARQPPKITSINDNIRIIKYLNSTQIAVFL